MQNQTNIDLRALANNVGAVADAVASLSTQLEEIKVILRQIAENLEEAKEQK